MKSLSGARVAQLVACWTANTEVLGSGPSFEW